LRRQVLKHRKLDYQFHALASPTRRAIVEILADGDASVGVLARLLYMSLPAIAPHVQVLEASGLICTHKAGRVRVCRVLLEQLHVSEVWLRRLLWKYHRERLGLPPEPGPPS
jgi:DNA-binding transcriptional ArsR family regulator